jgi:DNA mismatch repair protein MSH5
MVFKVPHKPRRGSSVTGSQGNLTGSPASRSVPSSSSTSQSHSSKNFAHWRYKKKTTKSNLSTNEPPTASLRNRVVPRDGSYPTSIVPSDPEIQAEDDVTLHEREESDALNEVVMALELRGRDNVGCSFYVAREETLYILSDVKFGGLEILDIRMS